MMKQKKTVLITGATGVIGSCLTEYFAKADYQLILTGRSKEKLDNLSKKIKGDVLVYAADMAEYGDIKKLFNFVAEKVGRLDVVIPAAGIYGEIGTIEQCDAEKWEEAFRVNVFGVMRLVKESLPLLKKSDAAAIIFFAGGGEGALSNFSAYAGSKGAVIRLAETLAQELTGYNIRVNTIYPGAINSGFVQNILEAGKECAGEKMYQKALDQISGKEETVTPDKAGEFCLFLASDKAAGITGKVFAARYDDLEKIQKHKKEIMSSDIYTSRRLKPEFLGYDW